MLDRWKRKVEESEERVGGELTLTLQVRLDSKTTIRAPNAIEPAPGKTKEKNGNGCLCEWRVRE